MPYSDPGRSPPSMKTTLTDVTAFKPDGRRKIKIPISKMKDEIEDPRDADNRLTSFVREYYLDHLKKRLFQNVQSCSSENCSLFCDEDVERCAIQMEHKALRQCMVVRLYQQVVTSMVADIKRSTEQSQLHRNLQSFIPSSRDQATQTETVTLVHSQLLHPLSRVTVSDSSVPINIKNEKIVSSKQRLKNSPRLTTLVADVMEYDSGADSLIESDPLPGSTITYSLPVESVTGAQLNNPVNISSQKSMVKASSDFLKELACKNSHFDLFHESKLQAIKETKSEPMLDKSKCSSGKPDASLENAMLTLDQRVAAIHGEYYNIDDGSTDQKAKRKTKKKIIWCYEKVHRYKILNNRLHALGKLRRLKVEHRFLELFGKDHPTGATHEDKGAPDDPLGTYKERIAPWVVKYLMPHYTSKVIKSRQLFKYTAKYVTDNLIEKNCLPDEKEVADCVEVLFRN